MIDASTWCPDVVIQVASATRGLYEVAVGLLTDHLRHCVMQETLPSVWNRASSLVSPVSRSGTGSFTYSRRGILEDNSYSPSSPETMEPGATQPYRCQ
jgi:Metal-sensitive transcriptional repressor